jgi:hypothetical protein
MKFIHHMGNTIENCNGLDKVSMAGSDTAWRLGREYGAIAEAFKRQGGCRE